MIKRPLHSRFRQPVMEGIKTTTIRENPWPVGKAIMLYNWSGKAYRSPQIDVAAVIVVKAVPITIEHLPSGQLLFTFEGYQTGAALWATEGFEDGRDLEEWFRPKVKRGAVIQRWLMTFALKTED